MSLSFKPNNLMIEQLKNIQAKLGSLYDLLAGLGEAEREFISKQAFISNIGSSTRIENAVLTDQEIDWVDTLLSEDARPTAFAKHKDFIFNKLSKDKERSVEEVVGCREMLEFVYAEYDSLKPLREVDLRGMHSFLLRHYPQAEHYCGRYKPNTNRVVMLNHETGESEVVLDPASPGPITDAAMRDLLDWYNQERQENPWPLLVASEFTFRFLAIHPFQDGNGRISRALFLLCLLQSEDKYISKVAKFVALDRHIEAARAAYYLALRQCSDGKYKQDPCDYKLEPIGNFFLRAFEASLNDIELYLTKYRKLQSLTETESAVLQVFRYSPEKKLRVSDIASTTGLIKRSIQNAIKTLIKQGFLQKSGRGPQIVYQLVF